MQENAFMLLCGIVCIWPLLIGVLPTYLIMRYKPRITINNKPPQYADRQQTPSAKKAEERIGYGVRQ